MAVPETYAVITVVAPVATGVLGYWLSGRNDEARDRRAAEREKTARTETRALRLADERQAFQRETLLEIQDAARAFLREAVRVTEFDLGRLRSGQPLSSIPRELDDTSYETGVRLNYLKVRVLNDDLRAALDVLHGSASAIQTAVPAGVRNFPGDQAIDEITRARNDLLDDYNDCMDLLGTVLRRLL